MSSARCRHHTRRAASSRRTRRRAARRSCGNRFAVDEAQVRDAVELADVSCELEEREERGAFSRAEAVAELLEVAGEEPGRIAIAVHRLVGEHLRLRAGLADGRN